MFSGCAITPKSLIKPASELAHLGYLDVGAGYAVIPRGAPNAQDIGGFTATIKAYPAGRWYAPLKSTTSTERTAAMVKTTVDYIEKRQQKEAEIKVLQDLEAKLAADATATPADKADVKNGLKTKIAELELITPNTSQSKTTEALMSAINGTDLYQVGDCTQEQEQGKIKDRAICSFLKPTLRRFFVFYGHSIGGYGDAVNGEVNSVGIGYDITPEFALIAGRARYSLTTPAIGAVPAGEDTKDALLLGVQVNLNAFNLFRNLGVPK